MPQDTGKRLTAQLFESLRPEGKLLIANFSQELPERGYMESFMDWHLTYRSLNQVLDLASDIDGAGGVSASEDGYLISLEIRKR